MVRVRTYRHTSRCGKSQRLVLVIIFIQKVSNISYIRTATTEKKCHHYNYIKSYTYLKQNEDETELFLIYNKIKGNLE